MRTALAAIIVLIGFGCRQKAATPAKPSITADTTTFFLIDDYLKSQIKDVVATPYFIYALKTVDGKRDSSAINTQLFSYYAAPFKETGINNPDLKQYYVENIFHDQTTSSYTLNYTTNNKELPIQSVDVLLKEDAETVKRIFIRKFYEYGDSSAIEQLNWKPGESFQVNRLVQLPNSKEHSQELVVVWNNKE